MSLSINASSQTQWIGIINLNGTDAICKYEQTIPQMIEKLLLPVPMQTTQGPMELEPLLNFMVPPNDTAFAKSHLLVSLQSSLRSPFIPSQS